MSKPNDVDLSLHLWPHGWSTACIWVDGQPRELRMTHVFNDPLESLANAALQLSDGARTATVEWSDEPGTVVLTFNQMESEKHLLLVEVSEYSEVLPAHSPSNFLGATEFVITRDFWLHLVSQELNKIESSLRYRHYRDKRDYQFPHELLRQLRTQYKQLRSKK